MTEVSEREDIARIIDPLAARLSDELARTATLPADAPHPPAELVESATRDCAARIVVALLKADAIIARQAEGRRELVEALEFYAEQPNHFPKVGGTIPNRSAVFHDGGWIARSALSKANGAPS